MLLFFFKILYRIFSRVPERLEFQKLQGYHFLKKLGWNINFKNGQIWVIIGMVEKTENFRGHSSYYLFCRVFNQ